MHDSPCRRLRSAPRRGLDAAGLRRAERVVELAWEDLPVAHRRLLEAIRADRRKVVDRPLGAEIADLRQSAGVRSLTPAERRVLDNALGVWASEFRLVVLDAGHAKYAGLDEITYETALTRIAWHEWGHALSVDRATQADIDAGDRLLGVAPLGVAEFIRAGNYRPAERTHEVVAEMYALLMARRRRGLRGKPEWLADEIWNLMRRVTDWRA